jgi:general secretion pathway protein G
MRSRPDRCRRRPSGPHDGYTLLELLVVLVILGLLVGVVGTQIFPFLGRGKSDTAALQIKNFEAAIDLFRLDMRRLPTQQEGLDALVKRPDNAPRWSGPYLKSGKVPLDPWDRAYLYRIPGQHGRDFDLYSLGADGREGGDGENRDIGNWR